MEYIISCASCNASRSLQPDEPLDLMDADVLRLAGHMPDCILRTTTGVVINQSQPDELTIQRYSVQEVV